MEELPTLYLAARLLFTTILSLQLVPCLRFAVTLLELPKKKAHTLKFLSSFSSIGGKNLTSCTYQVQWKELNASTWRSTSTGSITFDSGATSKSLSTTIGSDSWQSADYIIPETDYLIKVTIRDTLGQPAEKQVELGTISYTMFFKKGGQGVAIGQPTQEESAAFEVNPEWQMIWGRIAGSRVRIPGVYVSDTEPPAKAGLIWLKPAT